MYKDEEKSTNVRSHSLHRDADDRPASKAQALKQEAATEASQLWPQLALAVGV